MYTVTWRAKGGRIEGVFVPAMQNLDALVRIFEKSEPVVQYKVVDSQGRVLGPDYFFPTGPLLKEFINNGKWITATDWPYVPWQ